MIIKKNVKKILALFLFVPFLSNNNSLGSDLRRKIHAIIFKKKLTASEKILKELYEEFTQTITFLRLYQVSSTDANRLNALFTPEIQKALINKDTDFLIKNGFYFYIGKNNIFSHKDFPKYIFKLPILWLTEAENIIAANALITPEIKKALKEKNTEILSKYRFRVHAKKSNTFCHTAFPEYIFILNGDKIKIEKCKITTETKQELIKEDILFNASRVWYGQWIQLAQNKFKTPSERVFFMKSKYPQFAIVVVSEKIKDFENLPIRDYKEFSKEEKEAIEKLENILHISDLHEDNLKGNYIVDTQCWTLIDEFLENPFSIYSDPLRKKIIQSKL